MTNPPPPTAVPDAPAERSHRPWGWVVAVLGYLYYLTPLAVPLVNPDVRIAPGLVALVVLPGLAALVALGWRRRYPAAVAWVCAVLWAVSPSVIGAALVAQEHVARRARRRTVVAIGLAMVVAKVVGTLAEGYSPGETSAQFEWTLAAAGVVVATLVGWLRASRTAEHQRRAEAAQARAEAEAARVNEARLAERERIAREMHDVIAHSLSVMIALADGAHAAAPQRPEESRQVIGRVAETGRRTLGEVRRLLTTVREGDGAGTPPAPALGIEQLPALVDEFRAAGLPVRLQQRGTLEPGATLGLTVYRIVQESLTNVLRHAQDVRDVLVRVLVGAGEVTVLVEDTSSPALPVTDPGRGLVGIQERAAFYAGHVSAGPRAGGGWRVAVRLPLEER